MAGTSRDTGTSDEIAVVHLYLARHGRTALNAKHVLRGLLDPCLDEVGIQQAERLAAALGAHAIGSIVASPLRRAVETATALATVTRCSVQTDARLIDRDYGRWAGHPTEELIAQWGSVDEAPGVEPRDHVLERGCEALDEIAQRSSDGAAVVVSHDAVIRLSLVALSPALGDPELLEQETGCFNALDWRAGRWEVVTLNETPMSPGR